MTQREANKRRRKAKARAAQWVTAHFITRFEIARLLQMQASERRSLDITVHDRRDLVVAYDPKTDETKVLSEYRREKNIRLNRSKYAPRYPLGYAAKKGVNLVGRTA